MKKVLYLFLVVLVITSCARGFYSPNSVNQFGTQTQVVLDQANFRVVRHLEVVVEINNSNLQRADVEKSAYAELLRRANLTGSQALINVVIEEVRRESSNIFRVLFSGMPKLKQHVAARATVIEFLDASGNPIASVSGQGASYQGTAPRASSAQVEEVEEKVPDIQQEIKNNHKKINESSTGGRTNAIRKDYQSIYSVLIGKKEYEKLNSIQGVVIQALESNGAKPAKLADELKKEKELNNKIKIFLKYAKK